VCRQGHHHTSPNPYPQPVTVVPKKPTVIPTRKTVRPVKRLSKAAADLKPAAIKPKKKAAASVQSDAAEPTTPKLVVPSLICTSPLEEISDLLDHVPNQARVEMTRRLLTSVCSLPKVAARPWAILKTVILFVSEYGRRP
jgi:hypothetical protein